MRIGIEAQRIFRKNKHGMDYVVLQEIIELQKMDLRNEYFVFVAPGPDHCIEDSHNVHIIEVGATSTPHGNKSHCPRLYVRPTSICYTVPAIRPPSIVKFLSF